MTLVSYSKMKFCYITLNYAWSRTDDKPNSAFNNKQELCEMILL